MDASPPGQSWGAAAAWAVQEEISLGFSTLGEGRMPAGPGPWSIAHQLVRSPGEAVLGLSAPRQPGHGDGGFVGLALFLPSSVTERLLWPV